MINNKLILCVIPARGGSKGIPLKNMIKIRDKSLIRIVAECAKQCKSIDRIILSTDSQIIAEEGKKNGIDIPFMRPLRLSGDKVSDLQVLKHALITVEKKDKKKYDYIVMLQPTSPLRSSDDVEACIKKIEDKNWDAIWTISEADPKNHPLKQLTLDHHNKLSLYDEKGSNIIARQQLDKLYYRNGVAYIFKRECILDQQTIMGKNTGGYLIQTVQISIDNLMDLELVDFYMNKELNDPK